MEEISTTIQKEFIGTFSSWLSAFLALLPNIIVALLIIVVSLFLARILAKVVHSLLSKLKKQPPLVRLMERIAFGSVLVLGLFLSLRIIGLDQVVVSMLAGIGIVGLALGFAFQDTASNFISGVFLSVHSPFKVGEHIDCNGVEGVVKSIDLRSTVVQTFQGQTIYIPNKDVFQNTVTNYSELVYRRVDVQVGVAYDTALENAQKTVSEALSGLHQDATRDIEVFFHSFGSSSIDAQVRFWIQNTTQREYLEAKSKAVIEIKKAFDKAGIEIPFPIRTIIAKGKS